MFTSRTILGLTAALVVGSGLLVAAPAASAPPGDNGTVCLVADPAGFDDASFNAKALEGATDAAKRLQVDLVTADPGTEAGIADTVEAWAASEQCDLIIGVGFVTGLVMEPTVAAYPGQRFAALDHVFGVPGNAASVVFAVDQGAFMAGYVAAAASSTGTVGTYGGFPFPGVTDFMNGYALGVEYYNATTGGSVDVVGWDVDTQSGLFSFDFTNPAIGFALAEQLFDQGADTVFPVAGFTSNGSYDAAVARAAAGSDVRVVYPDVDPYQLFDRDRARVLLTSVLKKVDVAAYHQIESLVDGTWSPGFVTEDVGSGGVDIAPFHRTNNDVPGGVRHALRTIRAGIVDGSIPTLP